MNRDLAVLTAVFFLETPIFAQDGTPVPEEIPESVTPPETVEEATAAEKPNNSNGRIVGGERAPGGSAPFQIEIFSPNAQYDKKEREADAKLAPGHPDKLYLEERAAHELAHKCGGSYIGGGWILTAAHCVPKLDLGPWNGRARSLFSDRRIRMGTQNLTAGGEVYEMERIVVHAEYSPKTKTNDIALIKVREKGQTARLGPKLKAITLPSPTKPLFANEDVWVTGWGWMAPRDPGLNGRVATATRQGIGGVTQHNPAELQQAKLKAIDSKRCQPLYPNWGDGMLCVGAAGTGRDSCQGDSGGPLVRLQGKEKVLVGIVSNGYGCGYKDMPAAYTRVSHYLSWIDTQRRTAPLGFSKR